jgi:glycerophosphoryl diester phosphodiesterase
LSLTLDLPPLIGHRGAAARAPENTLASLRLAHAEGASWVEFDVKLTADSVPILMHDDRLGRTTDGRGRVAKIGYDDLALLDAGGWFSPEFEGEPVPSLRAALETCAELGLGINVELKPCPGRAEETAKTVVAMVDELWPDNLPQPLFSSFDRPSLLTVKAIKPDARCGYLCTRIPKHWPNALARYGCSTLNASNRWIRQRHINAASARNVPILVYTVNDPARARKLIEAGVTTVFTDNVQEVAAALEPCSAAA